MNKILNKEDFNKWSFERCVLHGDRITGIKNKAGVNVAWKSENTGEIVEMADEQENELPDRNNNSGCETIYFQDPHIKIEKLENNQLLDTDMIEEEDLATCVHGFLVGCGVCGM